MSMSEKTQILFKILSLYLVSSVLFLSYFFIHDYQNKKEAAVKDEMKKDDMGMKDEMKKGM